MPEMNREGLDVLVTKIDKLLSWLTCNVQAEIKNNLSTRNVLAETIRQFGIEIMKIEIEDEMRNIILEAQKRQIMVNAEIKTIITR